MTTETYDMLRHFADSWGLIYMLSIFLIVVLFVMRPGAKRHAEHAARIPLDEVRPEQRERQP